MGKIVLLNLSPKKNCFMLTLCSDHSEQNRRTESGLYMSYSVFFTEITFHLESSIQLKIILITINITFQIYITIQSSRSILRPKDKTGKTLK